jgi:hypothetical protein
MPDQKINYNNFVELPVIIDVKDNEKVISIPTVIMINASFVQYYRPAIIENKLSETISVIYLASNSISVRMPYSKLKSLLKGLSATIENGHEPWMDL